PSFPTRRSSDLGKLQTVYVPVYVLLVELDVRFFELLLEHFPPELNRFPSFFVDPVTYPASGLVRHDKLHPVWIGRLLFGSDDLHLVAASELIGKRHHPAVDLGSNTVEAYLRMYLKCEIDRSGATRKAEQVALRRKDVNLFVVEIQSKLFDEFRCLLGARIF